MLFKNRYEAGRRLAHRLSHYRDRPGVLVLALPRGGVPVAFEVARELRAPLDVFLVRKIGVPWQEELAMGAVATGGVLVVNSDVVDQLGVSAELIHDAAERERQELDRQQEVYRHDRPAPELAGHTVILVDDGLATGSTMRAAVAALRQHAPRQIVVAAPVGAADTCREFRDVADEVICANSPAAFRSVGSWYDDFTQTTDEEVASLLAEADAWRPIVAPAHRIATAHR